MSDFIFSRKRINEQNKIMKEIQSIYQEEDKPDVKEFHGNWGSLGVSQNLYGGFEPYEDNQHIVVVIGGPILMYRDNKFLNDNMSSEGTKAIFKRWKAGEMDWDKDLSGPFIVLIVNKVSNEVICVTDLMSFIPVYLFNSKRNLMLATHVDTLARISGQIKNIDIISEVDFILHGVVTYPYTTYQNIFQVAPATEHRLFESNELKCLNYWIPKEEIKYSSINIAAIQLRESIQEYINKIAKESRNIAQFISGGEDSRTLSAMLKNWERDSFIFLDQINREGEIARTVASIYGANFKLSTRDKLHYLNILPSCSDLVGSGSQYTHAHTFGFHKSCKLQTYSAVFGGLFSDALLKGARIKKIRRTGKLPLIPEVKSNSYSVYNTLRNTIFTKKALIELSTRRKSHLEYIQSFRGESAEEWFELWPSSMNMNIPNLHVNRRLFRSYEPFMSNEVVKISASVPQKWKLNRRLFHKMAQPLLKPTKWLMHGDGWYPYYSWILKSLSYPVVRFNRSIGRKLGINKGNQGPWGEWNSVISSQEWINSIEEYCSGAELLYGVLNEKDIFKVVNSNQLNTTQRINLLQTLFLNIRK